MVQFQALSSKNTTSNSYTDTFGPVGNDLLTVQLWLQNTHNSMIL